MLALGFVALFVIIGLAVFFVAFRGGGKGAPQSAAQRRRKIGAPLLLTLGVISVGFGVAIPLITLLHNADDQAEAAIGGVKLNAEQEHGRELFKERCATCHTLEDAGAVGLVGPDLDSLRPAKELTLDAIANGRARGQGQMPAQLLTGPDARAVSDYVALVGGR
jgi:mono/diheme cytochrome c family protein